MDHHCPWINNCVGHYNHRSFTLFLAFVVIGCTHATCILVQCLWSHLLWDSGHLHLKVDRTAVIQMNAKYLIFFFFGVGLSVGVTASVGFLLYYQVKSIVKNATGIEMWILEKACRPGNQHFVYPYNLGFWDNVNEVLNLTLDYKGDGISWPIREKCHKYAFTMEQINQKAIKRQTMVVYNVTTEYRGSCMFYKWTMRSCMETPCCDETLLAVRPGDTINVSRWKREWLYGEVTKYVQDSGGEVQILKGWIPRAYASPTTGIHVSTKKME